MAEKKPARRRMNRLLELLEVPAAIGSSMVAEPLAGLAGLYGAATGGIDEGVRRIEDVRRKATYAPRSDVAKGALNGLSRLMEPVERGLNYAREGLGNAALNATGSPALATAAHMLPDAALSVIGGRQALRAAPRINAAGRQMLERSRGPVMGGPMAQDGMIAYHGTPHRFPPTPDNDLGAFDMSKIGTGEGAQAYGHGLYFADSPDVARSYRTTQEDIIRIDGVEAQNAPIRPLEHGAEEIARRYIAQADGDVPRAIRDIDRASDTYKMPSLAHRMPELEKARELVNQWDSSGAITRENRGSFYKVDIPDEAVAKFLDWDRPLSEQPHVQQALNEIIAERGGSERYWLEKLGDKPDGQKLLRSLSTGGGDLEKRLLSAGIPGIRYLDGGTRHNTRWTAKHPHGGVNDFADEASARAFLARNPEMTLIPPNQSHNYVVFDDKLPKIVGRE